MKIIYTENKIETNKKLKICTIRAFSLKWIVLNTESYLKIKRFMKVLKKLLVWNEKNMDVNGKTFLVV